MDRLLQIGLWIGAQGVRLRQRFAPKQARLGHVHQGACQRPACVLQVFAEGNSPREIQRLSMDTMIKKFKHRFVGQHTLLILEYYCPAKSSTIRLTTELGGL